MKIWLINQYAIPPSQAGITRHYAYARELIERGHEVLIIASSFDHVIRKETKLRGRELCRHEYIAGVPFLWLRSPSYQGNSPARVWNMLAFSALVAARIGTRKLSKPDVILASSPHLFGALAGERMARKLQTPFVLEVRDLWPQSLIDLGNVSSLHPAVKGLEWIEKYLYRRARKIISLLPGGVDHMRTKGADSGKVAWIPNGVEIDSVPLVRPPPHGRIFTMIYAGAHGLANGLDAILDAAVKLQEEGWGDQIKFHFVGDGPRKPHLERRVLFEGINNVEFFHPVAKNEIYATLSEADGFIVTLRKTNLYQFGISLNKIYDYLALARPVVFGANASNNPVAEAEAGYVVAPEDGQALAAAVKQLAGLSAEERWQMGLRGRRFAEEHHNIASLAKRLEEVFQEAVEEGK